MQARKAERGSSLAWTAIFLITVLLPLMLLIVDGARLLYLRGRLQTATDAACEDAAWTVGDRRRYLENGSTRFGDLSYAIELAQSTFASTLDERSRMVFSAGLNVTFDETSNQVLCAATATVPILFAAVGIDPQVEIPAKASAAIRFR
jgi:uncharacterized membrane protein